MEGRFWQLSSCLALQHHFISICAGQAYNNQHRDDPSRWTPVTFSYQFTEQPTFLSLSYLITYSPQTCISFLTISESCINLNCEWASNISSPFHWKHSRPTWDKLLYWSGDVGTARLAECTHSGTHPQFPVRVSPQSSPYRHHKQPDFKTQ